MAEIRPAASIANLPTAPRASARAELVRTAQAAFFQAALTEGAVARPAAPASSTQPVAAATPTRSFDPEAPAPTRVLRPGSLVDLKV